VERPTVLDLDFQTPRILQRQLTVTGNAAILAIQLPDVSPKTRALSDLISVSVSEPFFTQVGKSVLEVKGREGEKRKGIGV